MAQNVLKTQENGVRRPINAYFLFSNENRKIISKLNPNVGNREISRILGKTWAQLDREVKIQYFSRAFEIRRQHRIDNPGYFFSPKVAKKMRDQKRSLLLKRRPKVNQLLNGIAKNTNKSASKTIVCPAYDLTIGRMFNPLFVCPQESVHKPFESKQYNGTQLEFANNLGLMRKNDQSFNTNKTTVTPTENESQDQKEKESDKESVIFSSAANQSMTETSSSIEFKNSFN